MIGLISVFVLYGNLERALNESIVVVSTCVSWNEFARAERRAIAETLTAMAAIIGSDRVEAVLRGCLKEEGYKLSRQLQNGETGCDVIAIKGRRRIHIEVISFKSSGPARSRDFFQSFFRAISRLKDGATRCAIALPSRFGIGLPKRASRYEGAWRRIGLAFPELEIWLVNIDEKSIVQTKWNKWAESK